MPTSSALVGSLQDLLGQAEARNSKSPVKKELGKDAFLNLLVTQLRNQDPLKPMEDHTFIAEMAQFSSLEQMQNLNKMLEAQNQFAALSQASNLIGKEVVLLPPGDGAQTVKGEVTEVRQQEGGIKVVVGGQAYDAGWITTVSQASAPKA
jgi:flagellar basal-body rod modification protein FlgD